MIVKQIPTPDTKPFILGIHYARRMPSISYAFGGYIDGELIGICTFGTPPSATLRRGIAGEDNIDAVLELNRLCLLHNVPNQASELVSKAIKLLPRPKIIVSFADTSQNHVGTVYQACNFLYTGLSAKRTDWKLKGKEHLHGQTVADEFRGQSNRAKLMREKYGDDFYLEPRPRKHRYVYITGSKGERRRLTKQLRYNFAPYPK